MQFPSFIVKVKSWHYALLLLVLFVTIVAVVSDKLHHYPYGDGPEYILMTEALHNHASPEIRQSDIDSYMDYLQKNDFQIHRKRLFLNLQDSIASDKDEYNGFFRTNQGDYYSYHFWLYSLVNVPARALLSSWNGDIRSTFFITNLFIMFFGLWLISRLREVTKGYRTVLSLLLIFSPMLWYLDWAHAEVWGGVLTFLGVLLFFVKRRYSSLLAFSLAAVHYPPLFIPALVVFVEILIVEDIKWKVLVKLFFSSFWIVVPSIFYLIHFGTPSLIADSGNLSTEVVDLRRLFNFFFDLDQGMILVIPLILLTMIGVFIYDLIRQRFNRMYLMLLSILLMSIIFMQMINWSHTHAVANRYTVWTSAIVIVVLFARLSKLKKGAFYSIFGLLIISQSLVVFLQYDFTKITWDVNRFNSISTWVLNNHPSWYNPDPYVFMTRNSEFELSTTDSVMIYTNEENRIVKMLVYNGAIWQLEYRGVDREVLEELNPGFDYYHGYAYLNPDDLEALGYEQDQDTLVHYIERTRKEELKKKILEDILNSPEWYEGIRVYAVEEGIPLDSALKENVDYMYWKGKQDAQN
ncbi:hypothetical protein [Halocola ammonii]